MTPMQFLTPAGAVAAFAGIVIVGMLIRSLRKERLHFASERHAGAIQGSTTKTSGILFLGSSYSPWSTACLQTLVELGHHIVVGRYEPLTKGVRRLVREKLQAYGWRYVLRKAAYLRRSKTRITLRRMGVPLSGFASLPELCRARGLRMIRCTNPNGAEFIQQVQLLGVDLIVVAGFPRILKRALIDVPRLGCINVHPSLLPRYRGLEPCYWVLANQENTTSVTIHHVDEGIDTGDILLQGKLEIRPNETEITLGQRVARVAGELLREAIPLLLAGRAPRIRQDHSAATYYSFPGSSPKRVMAAGSP